MCPDNIPSIPVENLYTAPPTPTPLTFSSAASSLARVSLSATSALLRAVDAAAAASRSCDASCSSARAVPCAAPSLWPSSETYRVQATSKIWEGAKHGKER
jgi:hypothetical protein